MKSDTRTMPTLLTYEDYCLIPNDGNRYEVVDGALHMSPAPIIRHQQISIQLVSVLFKHVTDHDLGLLFHAPCDVVLSEHNVVQPDMLFISKERTSIITDKNVQGAPDLLVEILSEGNRRHDEVVKRKLYESFDVNEYWIIDPVLELVKVYRLEEGSYSGAKELSAEREDVLSSPLLSGFELALTTLFKS
ncbi:MAG: Uma2 family endonuclease [Rhodothermaceae bacterium]|nr:Uma2 family endonuclease [Rhodothermaceae bacterium]